MDSTSVPSQGQRVTCPPDVSPERDLRPRHLTDEETEAHRRLGRHLGQSTLSLVSSTVKREYCQRPCGCREPAQRGSVTVCSLCLMEPSPPPSPHCLLGQGLSPAPSAPVHWPHFWASCYCPTHGQLSSAPLVCWEGLLLGFPAPRSPQAGRRTHHCQIQLS